MLPGSHVVFDEQPKELAHRREFALGMGGPDELAARRAEGVLDARERTPDILPESRNKGYDVRKLIECIVDRGSLFESKARFGRAAVIALVRLGGRSIGVIASHPVVKGGAMDVDACRKAIDSIVLCDSFNVPLVFVPDQPGFLIGKKARSWP